MGRAEYRRQLIHKPSGAGKGPLTCSEKAVLDGRHHLRIVPSSYRRLRCRTRPSPTHPAAISASVPGSGISAIVTGVSRKACNWLFGFMPIPVICPLSLIASPRMTVHPASGLISPFRSNMLVPSHRNACSDLFASSLDPTTWPLLLMPFPELYLPPSVPRSCMPFAESHRNARKSASLVWLVPVI